MKHSDTMTDVTQRYAQRIAVSNERIADAYRHRDNGVVPFQVVDVNYWISGESPESIPDDYFTNCETMMRYQVAKMERHMAVFDDDYIPFLFPWYGTGVIPSALGAKVLFQPKMDPAVDGTVINSPEQVRKLVLPDPEKDGLMPRVLETIHYFREHSDLPISCTDPQGPLTTALTLTGPETLFVWFYEQPRAAHELMEFCTEVFIRWIKAQKQAMGPERGRCCFPHAIVLPEQFGKVWFCDDDCGQISAEQYREFVMPYNERVLLEFGGGTLHFCGSAEHQIENFAAMKGLVGLNNFCMGNFAQVYRMQDVFAGRIALKVCDFTPLRIAPYYDGLFAGLRRRGTIVGSFVSPELALDNGRYEMSSRRSEDISREAYASLRGHCESRSAGAALKNAG
jgi:uroporphyrinogen-III decarboxylase